MAIQYFSVPGGTLIPHPGDTEIQDEAAELTVIALKRSGPTSNA
jgi:hypothetical protein